MEIDRPVTAHDKLSFSTWPDADSLAALRAWFDGQSSQNVVARFLVDRRASGQSSRSMIVRIKRQLISIAIGRGRKDLAESRGVILRFLYDHTCWHKLCLVAHTLNSKGGVP